MSKEALARLAKEVAGDSKEYRKQTLYKAGHVVDLRQTSITEELRTEISLVEPELLNILTDADIKKAASTFRRMFTGLIGPQNIEGNLATQPSYDAMQRKLSKANEAALAVLSEAVASRGGSVNNLKSGSLIQLDHVRTSAETRYAQAFSKTIDDPLTTLKALHSNKFLTKEIYDKITENMVEIISYYSGNSKTFELNGKVQVSLRSGTANQDEGRSEVNSRIAALKKAINAAVASNNWPTQAASDSYNDFVLKQLQNAVVGAGGTGKRRTIDTKSSKVKAVEKTKEKVVRYSSSVNTAKKAKRATPSKYSLQRISNYINQRLPEAMRANMGHDGALTYRTGRLANSAKVISAQTTKQGYPSLGYTYQRNPYDVFDPILGAAPWNKPGRDPKKLVEKSIRDIAKELAIGRFYLRRE